MVYPELALTTFFPALVHDRSCRGGRLVRAPDPNAATRPLFEKATAYRIGLSFGYAELAPDGHHFNTSIWSIGEGKIVGKYRKVHLPGHAEFDPQRALQHLEKRYFEVGDLGFPVSARHGRLPGINMGMLICNDRRWPEAWRVLGLQGVELVVLGYNTPSSTRRIG